MESYPWKNSALGVVCHIGKWTSYSMSSRTVGFLEPYSHIEIF
jgi:hypothetical protein